MERGAFVFPKRASETFIKMNIRRKFYIATRVLWLNIHSSEY